MFDSSPYMDGASNRKIHVSTDNELFGMSVLIKNSSSRSVQVTLEVTSHDLWTSIPVSNKLIFKYE